VVYILLSLVAQNAAYWQEIKGMTDGMALDDAYDQSTWASKA
jgi:hypothetical protein